MLSRTSQYKVVINHEEQYAIIPVDQALPRGTREVGKTGTSADCLKFIEEVWTDMTLLQRQRLLSSIGK